MRNNFSVKVRLVALFFLPIIFFTAPLSASSRKHPAQQSPPSDPSYVFALAAANHFLHAWQTSDLEDGTVLLSDGIRHSQNADKLERLFSNGNDRAFEIGQGHGHAGRYSFPVVLVTNHGSHVTRKSSEIILVETGKNDWVVDKLP
jgi:hypothetical protein